MAPYAKLKFKTVEDRPLILGVDPGYSGALALYSVDSKTLIKVIDMPVRRFTSTSGKAKTEIDGTELSFFLDLNRDLIRGAVIEEVGAGPNDGKVSAFNFGMGTGVVHGIIIANLIPIYTVKPSVWKSNVGLTSDKNLSIQKAKTLFPQFVTSFMRKKDDGRAEAALLAWYGERFLGNQRAVSLI